MLIPLSICRSVRFALSGSVPVCKDSRGTCQGGRRVRALLPLATAATEPAQIPRLRRRPPHSRTRYQRMAEFGRRSALRVRGAPRRRRRRTEAVKTAVRQCLFRAQKIQPASRTRSRRTSVSAESQRANRGAERLFQGHNSSASATCPWYISACLTALNPHRTSE